MECLKGISEKYRIKFGFEYEPFVSDILDIFNGKFKNEYLKCKYLSNICGLYHSHVTNNGEYIEKYLLISVEFGNIDAMINITNYYNKIKDYGKMKKYCLMGVELGNPNLMCNLGYCYYITKDYDQMKKYYLMAINLGDSGAMNNLGYYHDCITKDYQQMEKYYLMAINLGNCDAMNNLAMYHFQVTKNYSLTEKYYLMAVELNHAISMDNLANYHYHITRDYDKMKKYLLMAIELGFNTSMCRLGEYYREIGDYGQMEKYYLMANTAQSLNMLGTYYKCMTANAEKGNYYLLMAFNLGEKPTLLPKDKKILFKLMFEFYLKNECSNFFMKELYEALEYLGKSVFEEFNQTTSNNIYKYIYYNYVMHNIEIKKGYKTDFKIIAVTDTEIKEYYVHSIVLNSDYFQKLIDGNFCETNEVTINVSNLNIIEILIKYLYLYEINTNLDTDTLNELYNIADQYIIEELKYKTKLLLLLNKLHTSKYL